MLVSLKSIQSIKSERAKQTKMRIKIASLTLESLRNSVEVTMGRHRHPSFEKQLNSKQVALGTLPRRDMKKIEDQINSSKYRSEINEIKAFAVFCQFMQI